MGESAVEHLVNDLKRMFILTFSLVFGGKSGSSVLEKDEDGLKVRTCTLVIQ